MNKDNYLIKGDFVYREKEPIHALSAKGSTIHLKEESSVIDLEAANGTALLGYDSSILTSAIEKIMQLPLVPSFVESDLRIDLANLISKRINSELSTQGKVAFEVGGAQGIELALKIAAKANPGKSTILVLEGCYHGRSLATSWLSSSPRYRKFFSSSNFNVIRIPIPNGQNELEFSMNHIERLFSREESGLVSSQGSDLLCLIFEPVVNVAGLVVPDSKFLGKLVEKVRENNGLILADEIFTGFFRCGKFLGSQLHQIEPDILVMSKILTNGISPLSLVWGKEKLVNSNVFPPGEHSTTFSNSMLSYAVSLQVMERVLNIKPEEISRIKGFLESIASELIECLGDKAIGFTVVGLAARIELKKSISAKKVKNLLRAGAKIGSHVWGVLVASTGLNDNVIMLHPPLIISEEEVNVSLNVIREIDFKGIG